MAAPIQIKGGGVQAGPSAGQTFASNNTLGNLLTVQCRCTGVSVITGITVIDSLGNAWTIVSGKSPVVGSECFMAYVVNCKAGANTVTIAGTGVTFIQNIIAEYPAVLSIDKNDSATGTSTTPTSPSVTPTTSGQLILGGVNNATSNTVTYTAGSGYTLRGTNGQNGITEDKVQGAAAATTASFSATSTTWYCGIMTFKLPAAANSLMLMGAGT